VVVHGYCKKHVCLHKLTSKLALTSNFKNKFDIAFLSLLGISMAILIAQPVACW